MQHVSDSPSLLPPHVHVDDDDNNSDDSEADAEADAGGDTYADAYAYVDGNGDDYDGDVKESEIRYGCRSSTGVKEYMAVYPLNRTPIVRKR